MARVRSGKRQEPLSRLLQVQAQSSNDSRISQEKIMELIDTVFLQGFDEIEILTDGDKTILKIDLVKTLSVELTAKQAEELAIYLNKAVNKTGENNE